MHGTHFSCPFLTKQNIKPRLMEDLLYWLINFNIICSQLNGTDKTYLLPTYHSMSFNSFILEIQQWKVQLTFTNYVIKIIATYC